MVFLIFEIYKYIPAVTFVQHFIANTIEKQRQKQIRALLDITSSRVIEFKSIRDLSRSYMITAKLKTK